MVQQDYTPLIEKGPLYIYMQWLQAIAKSRQNDCLSGETEDAEAGPEMRIFPLFRLLD